MPEDQAPDQWLRHRLLFGRGMFSDDTEHSVMVARALLVHRGNIAAFSRSLAWSFRWWLLALPAGVGKATAKAILRLWGGIPEARSGVYSAGNGPAMRSAIIGAVLQDDAPSRIAFTRASCRLTHCDPRAEEAAQLVAAAASLAARKAENSDAIPALQEFVQGSEMLAHFELLVADLRDGVSVADFADHIGCGTAVSGFAPDTVAVALYAWLRHRGDYSKTVQEVILCGGDTDTVAAIAGGITGAELGEKGIPSKWLNGICDWPLSVDYLRKLAGQLHGFGTKAKSNPLWWWPCIVVRNSVFLFVILCHGVRRLFPPY